MIVCERESCIVATAGHRENLSTVGLKCGCNQWCSETDQLYQHRVVETSTMVGNIFAVEQSCVDCLLLAGTGRSSDTKTEHLVSC